MFSQHKKQTLAIHPDDPVFRVAYLGKIEVSNAIKPSAVVEAVHALWKRAHKIGPEKLPRVSITLGPHGIFMEDTRPNTNHQYQFSLGNISYCMANKGYGCVFAWVVAESGRRRSSAGNLQVNGSSETDRETDSRGESEEKNPRCHVVVCDREDVARAMALLMTAYFNSAYRDHKFKEKLETRKQETREMISELESRLPSISSDDDVSPAPSRYDSRQSSTRSDKSDSSDKVSPIHAMVAKAFGMSPKALSETDSIAMRNTQEKLRTLKVDPDKINGRGELETMFNWVGKSDAYAHN
nr:uncharacterized protein LOC129279194 [Lytechinus pictus]